jgi:HAD superfamily hydrolase (TIGR01509 family)
MRKQTGRRSVEEAAVLALSTVDAVLFDLDGVLTDTAKVHERAWDAAFTELFRSRSSNGVLIAPFSAADYRRLVDGEPRLDGVLHVLADRQIKLPLGASSDPSGVGTAWAIANLKDAQFLDLLRIQKPVAFPSSVKLAQNLKAAGIFIGVVSASRHCVDVLEAAGIDVPFDTVVDGWVAAAMRLPGKPDAATYLEAAARLDALPARSVVIEDAVAGVEAGVRGGFGIVIGLDRTDHAHALESAGATLVVSDLSELTVQGQPEQPWIIDLTAEANGANNQTSHGRTESLGTLANGYIGTRAARGTIRAGEDDYAGTYLAGIFDRVATTASGRQAEYESLVNLPDWLPYSFSAGDGDWLEDPSVEISDLSTRLDLRRGILTNTFNTQDREGRQCTVTEQRIVSMSQPHLMVQKLTIIANNWSGKARIRMGIGTSAANRQTEESRLLGTAHLRFEARGENPPDMFWLSTRTIQSDILIAYAGRVKLAVGAEASRAPLPASDQCGVELSTLVSQSGRVEVQKTIAIFTSRDRGISEPSLAARATVASAAHFQEIARQHKFSWDQLWQRAETSVALTDPRASSAGNGSEPEMADAVVTTEVVNLQLFHLLQVASPNVADLDVGIPARGLAGESYLGHIFWDELFVFPVLNLRFPDTARALLQYRQRRMSAARTAALGEGHRGAMFPWQSGSDGRDETPASLYNVRTGKWIADHSHRQRHVGLAVAYNFWQHWETTGDTGFLFGVGAEVLLETARFFASLATFDPALSLWRIRGVMGPDEFHDGYPSTPGTGVDDNAYTNVMTAWLMSHAKELVGMLREADRGDVLERIGLSDEELQSWEVLSTRLYVPFHDGVISQFAGYELLAELNLEEYRKKYGNIGRLDLILDAEGDSVRNYRLSKQADTLMLFYLLSAEELREVLKQLGHQLTPDLLLATIDYYSARAVHGSSLSAVVHAWVQARTDRAGSWAQFRQALDMDYGDLQGGTTAEGIHLGAMAGSIDILQRCYTGLEVRGGALWLNPELPEELRHLHFTITYRDHRVLIDITDRTLTISAAPGRAAPAVVIVGGRHHVLKAGRRIEHQLDAV